MPEVGSQPRTTAKTQMPMIAIQKSGTLAAVIDMNEVIRSASELGRYAAQLPMMTASTTAIIIVATASCRVAGKARSAIAAADSPVRSDVPKSRCSTPLR